MKILITNTVVLNGGDAAILYSTINVLRKFFGEDIQFTVYDYHPDIAKQYYPELVFRKSIYFSVTHSSYHIKGVNYLLRHLKLLRFFWGAWCWRNQFRFISKIILSEHELQDLVLYDSADLIVSTGGTYLVENYDLIPRIFDYKITLLMRKPLVFFTQSLGPFRNKRHMIALRKIFSNALVILLRDKTSFEHLKDLDIDMSNASIFPDVAFALEKIEIPKKVIDKTLSQEHSLSIAISVRHWPFFKDVGEFTGMKRYMEVIQSIVTYLTQKYNASITFISTCQGIPEYWTDDSKVALDICNGLSDATLTHVRVDQSFHTPSELTQMLGSFDAVIATRMHMAILSLIAGTPVLPIAYEFKTKELFKRLGMSEWTQDIETLKAETFKLVVDSFLANLPDIIKKIADKVAKERELSYQSGNKVKEEYDRWLGLQESVIIGCDQA